ncbi:hypothetical protein E3J79_04450 [Candidatus Dependentiae bacterium]|nr:MAG: hypothetical protein E3J79_04450 [Candidatus Dependentiae bacterium]
MKGINLLLSALLLISGTCAIKAGVGDYLSAGYGWTKGTVTNVFQRIPSLQDIKTACEINRIKGLLGTFPANAQEYIKSNPAKAGLIAVSVPVATWILWKLLPAKKATNRNRRK